MKPSLLAILILTGCTEESAPPAPPGIGVPTCVGPLSSSATLPQRVECSTDFTDADSDIDRVTLAVRDSNGAIYNIPDQPLTDAAGKPAGTTQFSFDLASPPSRGLLSIAFELVDEQEYSSNMMLTMVVVGP